MSLRDWIASFPIPATATTATTATGEGRESELSQASQLSQWVGAERATHEVPRLSQVSQVSQPSQPMGDAVAHGGNNAREAFEERAAIMEFDGGFTREEAERQALLNPPVPAPRRWSFEEWGDLRPCTLCRNLARSGRCLAAWRGEIRAARDYEPSIPAQPRRCIGYAPKADDPEQTSGMERWPELTWQETVLGAREGSK